jgi:hypothetical protein
VAPPSVTGCHWAHHCGWWNHSHAAHTTDLLCAAPFLVCVCCCRHACGGWCPVVFGQATVWEKKHESPWQECCVILSGQPLPGGRPTQLKQGSGARLLFLAAQQLLCMPCCRHACVAACICCCSRKRRARIFANTATVLVQGGVSAHPAQGDDRRVEHSGGSCACMHRVGVTVGSHMQLTTVGAELVCACALQLRPVSQCT